MKSPEPISLVNILHSWLLEELPDFFYLDAFSSAVLDTTQTPWLGFIYCNCNCNTATARVEADKICIIDAKETEHEKCPGILNGHTCYCGEKLIMLHDMKFPLLKKLLIKNHKKIRARQCL